MTLPRLKNVTLLYVGPTAAPGAEMPYRRVVAVCRDLHRADRAQLGVMDPQVTPHVDDLTDVVRVSAPSLIADHFPSTQRTDWWRSRSGQ
jgi:hypothetical protein